MALNTLVDSRDVRFVLNEMLKLDKLSEFENFSMFDSDTYESILDLAEKIAVSKVYPANAIVDKIGAKYDPATKKVTIPQEYITAMEAFNEAGFTGLVNDPEWGGMGMPETMYRAVMEYFFAGSVAFTMNVSLLIGATNLVKKYAPEDQKKLYLERMISGEFGGTMCLTEPDAGSDVGALKTKAVKQADGTYRITGQKIFISAGESDEKMYKNIIHPVLARIEGDPAGTKGISIFLVPKIFCNPDGSLGAQNDVVCTGIEHKMGIKGSPTAQLSFGDNGKCVGYLMGEERQGMKIMFGMMNEARLDVALQGLGVSSSAYMHSVTYAKNRVQGSNIDKNAGKGSCTIVKHPDVRRMLLWMKANVESMRMLTYLAAYCSDVAHAGTGDAQKEASALLEFLIPLCKAGNTDLGYLITSEAMQVYGGYGYCSDYPVEQLARDSKILAIYEGTNGIQSIDLTMRKLLVNPGMVNYNVFKKRIAEAVKLAEANGVDKKYVSVVTKGVEEMDKVVKYLGDKNTGGNLQEVFANATPLQNAMRMLAHSWMHLWSLALCTPKLKEVSGGATGEKLEALVKDNAEAAYYYGKTLSGKFYIGSEFHRFYGITNSIMCGESAVMDSFDNVFTGSLEG